MTTWAYILVDLENVQPEAGTIQRLHEGVRVLIFAKAEDKITIDVAKILMREPCNEFVLTSSTGKNAADFHIACQLGMLSRDAPSSTVYVISKDTGYDSIIAWLNGHTPLNVRRLASMESLPVSVLRSAPASESVPVAPGNDTALIAPVAQKTPGTLAENAEKAIASLRKFAHPPRTRQTLLSALSTCFQKQLSEPLLAGLVNYLVHTRQCVHIDANDQVSYTLPPEDEPAAKPEALSDRLEAKAEKGIAYLRNLKNARPRKRQTLLTALSTCFQKQLSELQLAELVDHLVQSRKCVKIDSAGRVTYTLPPEKKV